MAMVRTGTTIVQGRLISQSAKGADLRLCFAAVHPCPGDCLVGACLVCGLVMCTVWLHCFCYVLELGSALGLLQG